ncbi:iron-sulfur cluster assembly protein [Kribbella shirazensis]|uniref:Metal-sulfur cluster biosynthetic enzyme n=1 Tax=Kribbella shirazensis TaxID=1105143 RepID=A0A7X5VD83_9ACTN|nr:iron-sulfur cluster assembly protein [Kribbella shirazensis]NIK58372.1 metal-sulfur cluster biosynthetic enzyme [Kribbella shirazensis]
MTAVATSLVDEVLAALATVMDPELDEPITELGFVRSIRLDDTGVTVHLRLPTSFCSPNFAYLMASDAQDALRRVEGLGRIVVQLDDHHDSEKINAGLVADAGYVGTFGVEADTSLDELRSIFLRKAHTAAMERSAARLLRDTDLTVDDLHLITLAQLPEGRTKEALLRRRVAIGLGVDPGEPVVVDEYGGPLEPSAVPLRLRFAKAVRISIEGNSHFCRGLLATRYADAEPGGMSTRVTNLRSTS